MENKNIVSISRLVQPSELKITYARSKNVFDLVSDTRKIIGDIIAGRSNKKLFIVGPCSIHNVSEAYEYALKLKNLSDLVKDKILIVMRVYFEKPRTTIGWKGLINDPDLNNSFDVNKGLAMARKLLLDINELGLPCGYEVLDTITPQYISDLMSWGAIGARTTESQVHRQMVSGLSMPIGFKNGTTGNTDIACDAIESANYSHCFMGITENGDSAICKTSGNPDCHIILRGGKSGPNYYAENIIELEKKIKEKKLKTSIMVDCSHGNSNKDYKNQHRVLKETIKNMKNHKSIIGIMLESNINEGRQNLSKEASKKLLPGISITDSCISIDETFKIVLEAYQNINS